MSAAEGQLRLKLITDEAIDAQRAARAAPGEPRHIGMCRYQLVAP